MLLRNEDVEKASAVKSFLENNYREHYDYAFLTKKFMINRFKLGLAFKAITNTSIHAYVSKVRVEHAKWLLESTDYTIAAIAAKVGLEKSNLNIQFKKLTGVTPSRWRKGPSVNGTSRPCNEQVFNEKFERGSGSNRA